MTGKARGRGAPRKEKKQTSENPARDEKRKKQKEVPGLSYAKKSSKTSDVPEPTSPIYDQKATSSKSKKELKAKKLSSEGGEGTSSGLVTQDVNIVIGRARGRGGPRKDQNPRSENLARDKKHKEVPESSCVKKSSNTSVVSGPTSPVYDERASSSTSKKELKTKKVSSEGGERTSGLTGRGGNRRNRPLPQPNLITRPQERCDSKKGSFGEKIMVKSNYFRLLTQPKWALYQYRVDVSPEEDRTSVRRSLLRVHGKYIGGYIFDGTILYTTNKLSSRLMVLHSTRKEDDEKMTLKLKLVGDVAPGDYVYIQVFNILMRKCYSSLKLQLFGRDFYDKDAKIDIKEHKLQIWPGYKTTIAQHESAILMVAEISHRVIRTDTVLDNLIQVQQQAGPNYQTIFKKEISGQIILTDYNNRTYLINDVDWHSSPRSTFVHDGQNLSYIDYYRKKYQIIIRNHSQPLLVSLPKKRDIRRGMKNLILLIPELCRMTGLTDKMRSNFQLMKALSTFTRVSPETRINKLLAFNRRLQYSSECVDELKNWNMTLDKNLVEFEARKLPEEKIYQGKGDVNYDSGDTSFGWTKNLRSHPFISSAPVHTWAVLTSEGRHDSSTNIFINNIIKAAAGMSFKLPKPIISYVKDESLAVYVAELEKIIANVNPSIIMCCLKGNRVDLYNAIKKKCCIDRAIPSQVVTSKSLNHKNSFSIATKVAIQMNCKLGGAPWTTHQPLKNLMVIGYDVCHDPQNKSNSYGAMVSSVNRNQTKYFSTVTRHCHGEEIGTEFCINMKMALQKYNNINQELPAVIVIYRDGVGEGQIAHVVEHEVEIIKSTLKEHYGEVPYRLQFVIVSKRLNTRFFLSSTSGNPKPGTVIDDVVTNPNRYDFFLISQPVRDGTVAPTSYNIIFDNSGLNPDYSQRLAYKFCHMYYNVSGQVRVPGPCQYAHKLAFLASQNLRNVPNAALNSVLFYL